MTACAALSKPTRRVLPPMVGLWRKRSDHHYLARPATLRPIRTRQSYPAVPEQETAAGRDPVRGA